MNRSTQFMPIEVMQQGGQLDGLAARARELLAAPWVTERTTPQQTEATQSRVSPNAGAAAQQSAMQHWGDHPASEGAPPSDYSSYIQYANQDAVRNLPLSTNLANAMGFLKDMGITMQVFSGGQDPNGKTVGSVRHNHGDAADVFFMKDGRQLDWANANDLPYFQQIVKQAKANGLTGFGAGKDYMRPGSMHIGYGNAAVWGAGGLGENAADWLRAAYYG